MFPHVLMAHMLRDTLGVYMYKDARLMGVAAKQHAASIYKRQMHPNGKDSKGAKK